MQDWICFTITFLAPPFRKRERTGANSDTHAQKANLLIATFHTWLSLAAVTVPGKGGIISKSDQG